MMRDVGRERIGLVLALLVCGFCGLLVILQAANATGQATTSNTETAAETGSSSGGSGEPTTEEAGTGPPPEPDDLSFLCTDAPDNAEVVDTNLGPEVVDNAQAHVEKFLATAYGPADDAQLYEQQVEQLILGTEGCFWDSSASSEVDEAEEIIRNGGELANGYYEALVGFYAEEEQRVEHASGAEYAKVFGEAVFLTPGSDGTELQGYKQELYLVRRTDVPDQSWKITWGAPVSSAGSGDEYERDVQEKIEEVLYGG